MKIFSRFINVVSLLGSLVWLLLSNVKLPFSNYPSDKKFVRTAIFSSAGNHDDGYSTTDASQISIDDGQEQLTTTTTAMPKETVKDNSTSRPTRSSIQDSTPERECPAAAIAMHSGVYVHAGADASVVIASWLGQSTAFKVGIKKVGKEFDAFHRKTKIEQSLLTQFNHTQTPLLHWLVGPCMDENGIPFYVVEGNMIQWRSARENGLFEKMAWCQRLSIALKIDAAMDWLEKEGLEFDSYNWDDRTGGTGERQVGISLDGEFKFLDSDFVMQNDTSHWDKLRERAYKTYKHETLMRLRESNFVHGIPRIRRAIAKVLLQTLLGTTPCDDDDAGNTTCGRAWYAFRRWVDEQAALPYNGSTILQKSLASVLESSGIAMDENSDFASCMASSKDSQRSLLSNAYLEELAKGSRIPPNDIEKY